MLSMKPYKDPDELIKAEGAESYQKRIDEAESGRMFELLVLYGQYNSRTGKPDRVSSEAAKKLAQIEEPLERQTYLTSAANRFMIRKNDLENLVNRYGLGYQYEQVNEQYKTAPETEERQAEKEKKYRKTSHRDFFLPGLWNILICINISGRISGPMTSLSRCTIRWRLCFLNN